MNKHNGISLTLQFARDYPDIINKLSPQDMGRLSGALVRAFNAGSDYANSQEQAVAAEAPTHTTMSVDAANFSMPEQPAAFPYFPPGSLEAARLSPFEVRIGPDGKQKIHLAPAFEAAIEERTLQSFRDIAEEFKEVTDLVSNPGIGDQILDVLKSYDRFGLSTARKAC